MRGLGRRGLSIPVAVFVAGAVLLAVELAASRVLAPFFGNSLYVWGSLIGVVLAGLAIGYSVGGLLADRWPTPSLLVAAILLGGAAVLAIPLIDDPVLRWIVEWDPGPRLDPLFASIALFGVPSIILASVTPIAVRLRVRGVANLGATAGSLFSISTFGSIAGTFAAAFWLIPELGTDQLLAVGAGALFAGAAVVAFAERLGPALGCAALAIGGAVTLAVVDAPGAGGTLNEATGRNWSPIYRLRGQQEGPRADYAGFKVLYRKDTQYHRLGVVQDATERILRFDSSFQSAMDRRNPFKTVYDYTDYLQLGLAYNPSAKNMLFLGLGGGSAPKRVWRDFPKLDLQVVEIDPVVVKVARKYFHVPTDPRLAITVQDGRRYLATHEKRWDVIAIDTFYSDGIPFHLATYEFMQLARSRLAPGGVIVTNLIGSVAGEGSKLFRSVYRTYRAVFPTVAVHPVNAGYPFDPTSVMNIILVATEGAAPSEAFLEQRWRRIRAASPTAPDLKIPIENRLARVIPVRDVPTLTDDYAPTDALLLE